MTYWLVGEDPDLRPRKLRPVSSDHSHISSATLGHNGSFRRAGAGPALVGQCRSRSFDRSLEKSSSALSPGHDRAAVHYYQGQVHFAGQGQSQVNGDVIAGGGGGGGKAPPFLQPYGYLAGPSSQELLRRTSSRRRKFKFTIGAEETEELLKDERGDGVGSSGKKGSGQGAGLGSGAEHGGKTDTMETTPLLCRRFDRVGDDLLIDAPHCTSLV